MLTLESGSSCDVCMDDFGPRKLPHCIPCGHVLCLSCCNNILDNTTSRLAPVCPFCRQEFSRGTIRLIRIDFKRMSPPAQANRRKISNVDACSTSTSGTLAKAYLFAYNVLSAAAWMLVFHRTLAHLSTSDSASSSSSFLAFLKQSRGHPPVWVPSVVPPHLVPFYRRACTAYDAVGSTTALVQSVAVLEVLHSRFRLVRSPLPTTAMHVGGRLFSVWFVAARFISAQRSPFYASMVLSWALTGSIRYTFYAVSLVGWEFTPLVWARYLTFVLYPIGAGSEALVNLATLPISVWFSILPFAQWDAYALLRGVLFVLWWPGLYPMYAHMVKQRHQALVDAKPKKHLSPLIDGS